MKKEVKELKERNNDDVYHYLFGTMSVTLILLLILAFIASTVYIGISSMPGR